MCVIIVKNKGVNMPKKTVMERCWNSNIDGAGFSVSQNDKILIKKGFMKFEDFYNAVSQYGKKDAMVIHFRRTTQGGVNPGLTHPFPLDKNAHNMRALTLETSCAISHNGDIPMTGTPAIRKSYPDNSDTEIFVRDYATRLFEKHADLRDPVKLQILAALIGNESKMAIHTPEGIQVVGWFNEKEGAYFSNFSNAVHFDNFREL